jgi:hypothetical protein
VAIRIDDHELANTGGERTKTRDQTQPLDDTEGRPADVDRVATRADALVALHHGDPVASGRQQAGQRGTRDTAAGDEHTERSITSHVTPPD